MQNKRSLYIRAANVVVIVLALLYYTSCWDLTSSWRRLMRPSPAFPQEDHRQLQPRQAENTRTVHIRAALMDSAAP
ncbi:MAG: hypothetical protein V8Q42_08295 [Anaerovoracaceae bacterium]